ncbi:hypothetical protein BKA70DRAFT_1189603 [Coprinopsis sp. MPI-PUGE-AT-0042]|nr:hypothetical protein BKA70DRAFT_1189603 [Coprinopsis sp. MPI-PUGE-AT-0042]
MSTGSTSLLPPFEASVNAIQLHSVKDGKILGVSVYTGRAEVTRSFKFAIKTGQNQVSVLNLPNAMDQESFRVEGRGEATIHDVSVSPMQDTPTPTSSAKLVVLEAELTKTTKALERAKKALLSVNKYLESLDTHHTDVGKLQDIVDSYDIAAEKLDDKITELEAALTRLEKSIEEEKKALSGPKDDDKLKLKATIEVFAKVEGEVEIALVYAVHKSNWSAIYDIRVDMHAKEKPVTVIYKGAITQDTGEDWRDVPITLETASPTFGVEIPYLDRWTLNIYRSVMHDTIKSARKSARSGRFGRSHKGGEASVAYDYDMRPALFDDATAAVTSKGNITATFSIPGLMTIPSDGVAHNVTIANLTLDAEMEWVSIPKREAKVHLKAIVKNVSEYTFLAGPASVYVDGSFIARTSLPLVSPDETFDCPLGLDPTIRVTYTPVIKKSTQSGFMTKSRVHTYTQRITVHNTKSSSVEKVKIIDQIPVSEDSTITVKLISPALHYSEKIGGANGNVGSSAGGAVVENKLGVKVPAPVNVSKGITAQWEGVEEVSSESEVEDLGGEGKLGWLCSIPAQGKVNLTLQWEVSAPFRTAITGL